jgi:hypothetical protein
MTETTPNYAKLLAGFKMRADGRQDEVIRYLEKGDYITWYKVATAWNWDWNPWIALKWIIDTPDCDRGTALTIFWYSEPDYCLIGKERPFPDSDDRFLFPLYILTKWKRGDFTQNRIAFPGPGDGGMSDRWIGRRQQVRDQSLLLPGLEIPQDMVDRIPGLDVEKGEELFWERES